MTGGIGGRGGGGSCFVLNHAAKSPVYVSSEGFFKPWSLFHPKYFEQERRVFFFLNNLTIASQTVSIYVVPAHPRLYIASLSNFIISKSYHIFSNKNHLKKTASQNIRSFLLYFLFTCSDKLLEK